MENSTLNQLLDKIKDLKQQLSELEFRIEKLEEDKLRQLAKDNPPKDNFPPTKIKKTKWRG